MKGQLLKTLAAALTVTLGSSVNVSAQEVSFTVNEKSGDIVLRSTERTGVPGTVKVPYHKYNLYDGTLYTKGVTSKEYNANLTLAAEGDVLEISGYSDSKKTNVIFYTEGEEIEGATLSTHANVLIRASNSSSAYAESDLTITTLPSAKYRITVGCFDTAKAGNTATFEFTCGDVEFSITSNGNNLSEVNTDFMIFDEQPLVWKKGGSDTKSIDYIYIQRTGDATTEVKKYDYTVNGVDGDGNVLGTIATGNAEEGSTIKVGYSTYMLSEGTLYKAGTTNKEYNYSFELLNADQVETISYAKTDKEDVVFLSEGEDIEGMTECNSANTRIRSSRSSSAYAADADVQFTTLQPGYYILTAVIYDSAKSPNSNWIFKAGDKEIADLNCTAVNFQELSSEEFEISEETALYIAQGGSNDRGIDLIYIQKTGDLTTAISTVSTKAANDGTVYNLAGQRVVNATKGLYIVDGKKMVIK